MMAQPTIPIHISSLPTPLRLLSIPHRSLVDHTHALLRLLLSPPSPLLSADPRGGDRFLNVTRNAVELSIFADEALVERSFPTAYARAERGLGVMTTTTKTKTNGVVQDAQRVGERDIECSRETWIALQVEQEASSNDDWESAGARVKELSHPLAADGISILFLSTYLSDYLLVKQPDLPRVFDRLGAVGFTFDPLPADAFPSHPLSSLQRPPFSPASDAGPPSPFSGARSGSLSRSINLDRLRTSTSISPSRARGSPVTGAPGSVSLSGSVVLSEKGSASSSAPATPPRGPSVTMSRTATQEIPPVNSPTTSASRKPPSPPDKLPNATRDGEESALFKKVTILPDELVCVGLDRAYEATWMTAVIKALLFPADILPPPPEPGRSSSPAISRSDSLASDDTSSFASSSAPSSPQDARGKGNQLATGLKEFVSITQTAEEASLTADLSLLRALFPASSNEDAVIFTVGNGGLNGRWRGEKRAWNANGREEEDEEDEEEEEEAGEEGEGQADVESEDDVEPGRTVRSCLQIDLSGDSSFGLDRHGVVDMLSDRLLSASIPMLYTSTFKTANVLVPKSDLRRARKSLATE